MDKLLNKAIKTKMILPDELEKVIEFVSRPENEDDYYISSTPKKDRIGNYRELFINPLDKENQTKHKIYEIESNKDIIVYRLEYYNILRDESISFLKKSMLLYTLQKRIEYTFKNVLKTQQPPLEYKEVRELLEKVKKARSYYGFKVFLDNNSSDKKIKSSKDSVSKVAK